MDDKIIETSFTTATDRDKIGKIIGVLDRLTNKGRDDMAVLQDAFGLARSLEIEEQTKIMNADGSIERVFQPDNFKIAHSYSKKIRGISTEWLRKTGSSAMADLHRDTLLFDAKYDFDAYCRYLEWNRPKEKKFYEPRRKVLKVVADDLQDLYDDKLDLLGVSLPTRVGKSTLCIFFLSFVMGNRPLVANVMSGHSDKLTKPFHKELLNIITDRNTYNWHDVFPDVIVKSTSMADETIDLNTNKRFPTFTARAIEGTLTGAVEIGAGGLLYADDLVKDLEEAMSPERMEKKYNDYLNTLVDRKKEGAKELMVGTRWNVLDPLGRLREQYSDDPRYRFRVIPALNEEGESNFDYPYGLGFSTEYYLDMKAKLEDFIWQAKYQGDPYIREGAVFPKESLKRYFDLPAEEPDAIWAACDPMQEGGGDQTVLLIFYQYGEEHYLADVLCSNALPDVTDQLCAEKLIHHKVRRCQFESNSGGTRTANNIQALINERNGVTKLTTRHSQKNKVTRIISNSTWIKDHVLFKSDSAIENGSDYAKAMRLLTIYAATGHKREKDDVPDALSQYADFVIDSLTATAEIRRRVI